MKPLKTQVAAALTVCLLVALAGCGGDDESKPDAANDLLGTTTGSTQPLPDTSTSADTSTAPDTGEREPEGKRALVPERVSGKSEEEIARAERARIERRDKQREREEAEAERRRRERAAERVREERAEQLRGPGASVLRLLGYPKAKLSQADSGRVVTVRMPKNQACDAKEGAERKIERTLERSFDFIDEVRVLVSSTDLTLPRYQRRECEPSDEDVPLLQQSGEGSATSKSFTVEGRRWMLAYTASGQRFRLEIRKNGRRVARLGKPRRGKETRRFRGGGRFQLKITSDGQWSVDARPSE